MSMIPLGLHGQSVSALVVGGGRVGTRRALSLLEAGACVRVIAPEVSAELDAESKRGAKLSLERREYAGSVDIGDSALVMAATASPAVNERVANDARSANRLVNVADAAEKGSFVFLAAHCAGPITIGVSAGSVPHAAARIRDSIAERIDSRYSEAVTLCAELREKTLESSGSEAWRDIAAVLIDDGFCEQVENGTFAGRAARWR